MVDSTDTTACRCRGGAGKSSTWWLVTHQRWDGHCRPRASSRAAAPPGHSTPAAGLAHLPATPLRGGTPSRHLLNQPLANFTLSSGSGAGGTMTRHQTPGRRSKLTSNWGDWAKVQMSLTEGENAVVCSYNRGDLLVEEAPELRLEGSTGSTCRGTKMGLVGEDSGPRRGERTELFRSRRAPGVTSFIRNMCSGKGREKRERRLGMLKK